MVISSEVNSRVRRVSRVTRGALPWLPLLLLPICIGLGVVYYSAIFGLALGFTDWDLLASPSWIGFGNFAALFADQRFWHALYNTLLFVLTTMPATVILGLFMAVLMNRVRHGGTFFRLALFFPTTCSVVSVAFIWSCFYDGDGLFNRVLGLVGLPPVAWLQPSHALLSVSAMMVWSGFGYVALIYVVGLQSIPVELYEASAIDGASPSRQFWSITFPLLSPTTLFVTVTSMIGALQIFGQVYIMNAPQDATLTIMAYIYQNAFGSFQMGYAASMSLVLIVLIFVVTLVQLRIQRRWVNYDV